MVNFRWQGIAFDIVPYSDCQWKKSTPKRSPLDPRFARNVRHVRRVCLISPGEIHPSISVRTSLLVSQDQLGHEYLALEMKWKLVNLDWNIWLILEYKLILYNVHHTFTNVTRKHSNTMCTTRLSTICASVATKCQHWWVRDPQVNKFEQVLEQVFATRSH